MRELSGNRQKVRKVSGKSCKGNFYYQGHILGLYQCLVAPCVHNILLLNVMWVTATLVGVLQRVTEMSRNFRVQRLVTMYEVCRVLLGRHREC